MNSRRTIARFPGSQLCPGLLLVGLFAATPALALEIVDGPDFRFVAPHSVEVRWQTDLPSNSRVDYAINPPAVQTVQNPAQVTDHALVIQNLQPGQRYSFFITSAADGQSTQIADFLFIPPAPVVILFPAQSPRDELPPLVSGVVRITAAAAHVSVQIQSVAFAYVGPNGGPPVPIGVDNDGAEPVANSFEDAVTGDGWSVEWNTANLPQGGYRLIAQVNTVFGQFPAQRDVYLDPQPPQPAWVAPLFSDTVGGKVPLRAQGGQGNLARFQFQGPVDAVLAFSPAPLVQTNFPFDKSGGKYMCDPVAQAAIILSSRDAMNAMLNNPVFQALVNKHCKDPAKREKCIQDQLVILLARNKGTGGERGGFHQTGTGRAGQASGSNAVLDGLGIPWVYEAVEDKKVGESYTFEEFKAYANAELVRGVVVFIYACNGDPPGGHAMALVNINDNLTNGTYSVTFRDPLFKEDRTYNVAPNGSFSYTGPKGGTALMCIRSMGRFIGPPPPSPSRHDLIESQWQLIGTDDNGNDGWNAEWNPAGLPAGFYWLRVLLTDERGRSGDDLTEVFLAPPSLAIQRHGANVLARWPKSATNYQLEITPNLLTPDWKPAAGPIVVEGDDNTVVIETTDAARFVRLREL